MKRTLAFALSAAMLLALLCACSDSGSQTTVIPSDPVDVTESVQPTQTPPTPTPEPSDGPSAEPAMTPSEEPSQEATSQAPATPAPTPAPKPAPTPTPEPTPAPAPSVPPVVIPGFGGNTEPSQAPSVEPSEAPDGFIEPTGPSASDVDLTDFYRTVLNSYEFPSMEVLPSSYAANYYPGLLSIPAVQRVVSVPAMTGVAAEFTLVQVTDSSDIARVRSILEARRDSQIAGGAFYPAVVEQWERSCRIVANGNYIMMIVNADCDAIVADFNALF